MYLASQNRVAQTSLAVLYMRLHTVSAVAFTRVTVGSLLQLGGDELRATSGDDVLLEALAQLVVDTPIAEQETLVENCGADGHVLAGQLHALVDRAESMTHLQAHVPQRIEHVFDDALGPGGLLVVAYEQEIDVGRRRQDAAPIAAHRHNSHALRLGRVVGAKDVDDREVVQRRQRFIHHGGQQGGGIEAIRPLLQPVLRNHATAEKRGVDQIQRALALGDRIGAIVEGGGGELDTQLAAIDDVGNSPRTGLHRPGPGPWRFGCRHSVVHDAISSLDLLNATGGSSGRRRLPCGPPRGKFPAGTGRGPAWTSIR